MRYLLTFRTYGSYLHGEDRGSVDRNHNMYRAPAAESSSTRLKAMQQQMTDPPYLLNETHRPLVLNAIQQVCQHGNWQLLAAHIRTDHIHVVLEAPIPQSKSSTP